MWWRKHKHVPDMIKLAEAEYEVGLRDTKPVTHSFNCEHRGCPGIEIVDHELHCPIQAGEHCWHSKQMLRMAFEDAACPICGGKHAAFVCEHQCAVAMLREVERPDPHPTSRPVYEELQEMYA